MPPIVRVRRTTVVPLHPGGAARSSSPGRRVSLSPFDLRWVALPPVCRVFLYPAALPAVPFPDVARALRAALAAVLPAFHPFAGELAYSAEDSGTVAIVCGEDAGVAFVEAEAMGLELARLAAEGAEHDVDALRQLVPDIRRDELPAPVLAVQVTEFVGEGIAVGVAQHHASADGSGLFRFLEMWAAASAAAAAGAEELLAPPLHDRSLVRFDGDDELASLLLRQVAPDLPRVGYLPKVVLKQDPSPERHAVLSRRTFTLAPSAVRRLKQQLAASTGTAGKQAPASTFAALAVHGWVSVVRASGFTGSSAPVFAVFLADCRAHMTPRVPDAYAGNCLVVCVAALSGTELAGPDGPARAFAAISDAVAEVKRDPLADRSSWIAKFKAVPPGRMVLLVGSPRLPAYAVDFGFGRPVRSEHASMNHDGEMVLSAGREDGSVQVSVAIAADKMPTFQKMFVVN